MESARRCTKCKELKSLTDFYSNKHRADGLCHWCKICLGVYAKSKYHKIKAMDKPDPGVKLCRACRETLATTNFNKLKCRKDGFNDYCRYCMRVNHAVKMYGEETRDFFKIENRQCKICHIAITPDTWHIDHDHQTNKVRGILCAKCNRGLGAFGDDLNLIKSAVTYLENSTVLNIIKENPNGCPS